MPRYHALVTLTEKGVTNIDQSCERANRFRHAVEESGGQVIVQYWCMGPYDGGIVFDAPNESVAMALLLMLAKDKYVRTQTSHVLEADEFKQVLLQMADKDAH
jgi:uncharacterized protein with GYD domain